MHLALLSPRTRCSWLVALLLFVAQGSAAGVRDGAEVPGPVISSGQPGPAASTAATEVLVDFDDRFAPGAYGGTVPLRDEYLARGVQFRGGTGTDGGIVLSYLANFFVTGYSGANFLTFNGAVGTTIPFPYIVALPERILFTEAVGVVSIRVGSGSSAGATASMQAFDVNHVPLGSQSLVLGQALQPLIVVAPGIREVEVTGPRVMVLDDLRFTVGAVVPVRSHSWAGLKRLYH